MAKHAYQDTYIDVNYLPHILLADCNKKNIPLFYPNYSHKFF